LPKSGIVLKNRNDGGRDDAFEESLGREEKGMGEKRTRPEAVPSPAA